MKGIKSLVIIAAAVVLTVGLQISGGPNDVFAQTQNPELISKTANGTPANGDSNRLNPPQISANGRYVAFQTDAVNIKQEAGSTMVSDLFVKDRQTGQIQVATRNAEGVGFNLGIDGWALSGDGRHALLITRASNIDPTATTFHNSAYVKNLDTGAIMRASTITGQDSLSYITSKAYLSNDGSIAVFRNPDTIYIKNLTTGEMKTVTDAGQDFALSDDGRYFVYGRDNTNELVRVATDTLAKTVVSNIGSTGTPTEAEVANNGRVVFTSNLPLVPGEQAGSFNRVYTTNPVDGSLSVIDKRSDGTIPQKYSGARSPLISADGNIVAWTVGSILRSDKTYHAYGGYYSRNLTTGSMSKLLNVNSNLVPSDGFITSIKGLTASGSEAVVEDSSSNYGTPKSCQSFAGQASTWPVGTRQCNNVYVVSTSVDEEIVDTEAPVLSSNVVEPEFKRFTSTFTDNLSGIANAEFYVGSVDPGLGEGYLMNMRSNQPRTFWADFAQYVQNPGTYTIHYRAYDNVGNWSQTNSFTYTINPETTPPNIYQYNWTNNPKSTLQTAVLTAYGSDNSGIAAGEYFIGNSDPGQGNATPMNFSGNNYTLTADFGTNLAAGTYEVNFRMKDGVGNWSDTISEHLVVYDPLALKLTGRQALIPSINNGDILPGLVSQSQADDAKFAFNVQYDANGNVNSRSNLKFSYDTGSCKGNSPINCHSMSFDSNLINTLSYQGMNSSEASFQGTGTLIVDGQTGTVKFRVTTIDGNRITPQSNDKFAVSFYAETDDPVVDQPTYVVNLADVTKGEIKIQ